MSKKLKAILAFALTLLLTVSVLCVCAFAAAPDGQTGSGDEEEVEIIDIPDEPVPITDKPDRADTAAQVTGDNIAVWVLTACAAGGGLIWALAADKKPRDGSKD